MIDRIVKKHEKYIIEHIQPSFIDFVCSLLERQKRLKRFEKIKQVSKKQKWRVKK